MIELKFKAVTTDQGSSTPLIWLANEREQVILPIRASGSDIGEITDALTRRKHSRVSTHDLIDGILDHCNVRVEAVHFAAQHDQSRVRTEVSLTTGNRVMTVEARPADAVVLALRYDAPIFVDEEALEKARDAAGEESPAESPSGAGGPEVESTLTDEAIEMAIDELLLEVGLDRTAEPAWTPQQRLRHLKQLLRRAVESERYEEADQIKREIERIESAQNSDQATSAL